MHRTVNLPQSRRLRYETTSDPHGLVLIVVMVCLVVFATLCGVLLKLALVEQRQVRMQEWRLQAEWLAEAARLSREQGKVRLMIVFNVDFETYGVDPQAGYAIFRADGSCPACETLKAVMATP